MNESARVKRFLQQRAAIKVLDYSGTVELNLSEYMLLATLDMEKFQDIGQVAKRICRSAQAVSRQAKGLEEKGYLFRIKSEPDKRFTSMKLKAPGKRVIETYLKRLERAVL